MEKTKVIIEASDTFAHNVELLKKEFGVTTNTELVRIALNMLETIIHYQRLGFIPVASRGDENIKLIFLMLRQL